MDKVELALGSSFVKKHINASWLAAGNAGGDNWLRMNIVLSPVSWVTWSRPASAASNITGQVETDA